MSDAQLLSYFNRLEKILNETKIYTKLMAINKEGLAPNYYDEDDLLFPLEIGHEMYNKTLKVYMESKAYIDGIEKSLNKCIDKIGKNEKASHLINNQKFSNSNNNNNNNINNSNSSSSSSDEESSKTDQVGQKRKSKKITPGSSKMNKRPKQPSSDKEDSAPSTNSTTTSTSTSSSNSGSNKEKSDKGDKSERSSTSEKESNGIHTPSGKESKSQSTTPNKELNTSGGNGSGSNGGNNNNNNNGGNSFHGMQPGQLVAARDTKSNQWILAKVNSFSAKTQKYEVIDEDEDEPKRFSVGSKDIIQLPSLSNLPPTFPIQTKVLAMFPDTTAFYPAVVVQVQKIKGKPTSYHLHFEDDQDSNGETPNRRVNAQHVISLNK